MAWEYDAVIVGGGPAGLSAGIHLSRMGHRALILEKDLWGGQLQHAERIDDYPGFRNGITGANLASEMIEHATASGVRFEQGEASGVEMFSRSRWVACSDGRAFSCGVVILAGGAHFTRLGVPGERSFVGRGVIDCTPCDGGFFVGKPVVVQGANDWAVVDALYLDGLGADVTLLVPGDTLEARPSLQTEASRLKLRYKSSIKSIVGSDRVEAVKLADDEHVQAAGVAIRVGLQPATDWLGELVELDESRRIVANDRLETSAYYVLVAGDIRGGSRQRVATAVGDGANAAARAADLLANLASWNREGVNTK